jgi:hypothetical protein
MFVRRDADLALYLGTWPVTCPDSMMACLRQGDRNSGDFAKLK